VLSLDVLLFYWQRDLPCVDDGQLDDSRNFGMIKPNRNRLFIGTLEWQCEVLERECST